MNNSRTKIGIVCPLDDECNACKEILGLKNESELSGRVVSEIKEDDVEVYGVKAGVGKISCSSATLKWCTFQLIRWCSFRVT